MSAQPETACSKTVKETCLANSAAERKAANVTPLPCSNLAIVSHVRHYRNGGKLYAYGPYVREIDMWSELFPHITIAAPLRETDPPGDCVPFRAANVVLCPIRETGGKTLWQKASQVLLLPQLIWQLHQVLRRADAIHVRCPGNLGMLGVILGPLYSKNLVAKYAGQWTASPEDVATTRFQRWLLSSRWWRGPVTVYGQWPNQPPHVISFFTSIMDQAQLERARTAAGNKKPAAPFRVLFVGRLSEAKNVDVLIKAIAELGDERGEIACDIVGVGPQRDSLQSLAQQLGVADRINFVGGIEHDLVFDHYAKAHVLVLASETEGWPKAIAEAMACGVVCIGSNRGMVPRMLEDNRGLVVQPRNVDALRNAIGQLMDDSGSLKEMSERSAAWGQQFSLAHLREALRDLLSVHWSCFESAHPSDAQHDSGPA